MTAYRSDIDGLRAIAVLFVMAYHLSFPGISGGFIGVDVFFVISGYLITSVLSEEKGLISPLPRFYARRIRRLMPVFIVFSVLTTGVACVFLLPEDYIGYQRSLFDAFTFRSNYLFDERIKDYFGQSARQIPLLHTWSLSIEWQYYLLFPLLFLGARRLLPHGFLCSGMVVAAMVLAGFSYYKTGNNQQAYFYTSARFFELLLGGVVTFIRPAMGTRLRSICVVSALSFLLYAAFSFSGSTSYPGGNALAVCVAAAIVIWCGEGNSLLSNRALVYVGKISYSAYLWHWPFVAFITYLDIAVDFRVGVLLMPLVLAISHVSYRYVEQPGRRLNWSFTRSICCFIIPPIFVSWALYRLSYLQDGWFWRFGSEVSAIHGTLKPYEKYKESLQCSRIPGRGGDDDECHFGDRNSTSRLYLIGDSHARHYRWFVQQLANDAHLQATSYTYSECLMVEGASNFFASMSVDDKTHEARCVGAIHKAMSAIAENSPRYVLIGQRWLGYQDREVKKLENMVGMLVARNVVPVLMAPVPENGSSMKDCFYQHVKLRKPYSGECMIQEKNDFVGNRSSEIESLFKKIKSQYPQVVIIDPKSILCVNGVCNTVMNDLPIYADSHHLNGFGSAMLGKAYIEKFGNPLAK